VVVVDVAGVVAEVISGELGVEEQVQSYFARESCAVVDQIACSRRKKRKKRTEYGQLVAAALKGRTHVT